VAGPIPEDEMYAQLIRTRKLSKEALQAEALSSKHLMCHFPFNPWCHVCKVAHLRAKRYARTGEREDDELPPVTQPMQELSVDSIIVAKAAADVERQSASGCLSIQVIRDTHSGLSLALPEKNRTSEVHERNFKFFAGPRYTSPNIRVKSDADKAILKAVERLGWHALPSLENTWPHNTSHERHQGKLKGVQRASLLQCGFPETAWDSSASYSAVALSVSEFAPILPHERGTNGEPLDAHLTKAKWSCWQAFHNGLAFTGPIQPYGRLCFYRDTSGHPMTPCSSWLLRRLET
jgi:hypothetical protein